MKDNSTYFCSKCKTEHNISEMFECIFCHKYMCPNSNGFYYYMYDDLNIVCTECAQEKLIWGEHD